MKSEPGHFTKPSLKDRHSAKRNSKINIPPRQRTGKVARLPKILRDQVSRMLDDGHICHLPSPGPPRPISTYLHLSPLNSTYLHQNKHLFSSRPMNPASMINSRAHHALAPSPFHPSPITHHPSRFPLPFCPFALGFRGLTSSVVLRHSAMDGNRARKSPRPQTSCRNELGLL